MPISAQSFLQKEYVRASWLPGLQKPISSAKLRSRSSPRLQTHFAPGFLDFDVLIPSIWLLNPPVTPARLWVLFAWWVVLCFCWFCLSPLLLPRTSHYLIENFLFWLLPEGFPCPCSNAHPLPAFFSLHLPIRVHSQRQRGNVPSCWRPEFLLEKLNQCGRSNKRRRSLIQYTHLCQAGSWGCQELNRLSFSTYITGFLTGQPSVCLFLYHRNSKGGWHLHFSFPNGNHFLRFHFPIC